MAGKKKDAAKSTKYELHKSVIKAFSAAVDAGDGTKGFTYAEMRTALGYKTEDKSFAEIPKAMMELRDWGFVNHRFNNGTHYYGNPADIPNLTKRGEAVLQLVFYLTSTAIANMGGDDALVKHVESEGKEMGQLQMPEQTDPQRPVSRESISEFYNGLADLIDTYNTDPDFAAMAARHIQALKPS